jgi:hypothetical protein
MKKTALVIAAMFVLTITATAHSVYAADCQDLLNNNLYRCHVKPESGGMFDDCFQFTSPGVFSGKFDLNVFLLGIVQGCTCDTTGSLNNPHFNTSKNFHCVTDAAAGFGFSFSGSVTATSKKIKKGQVVDQGGFSYFYECELDPACSVSPALTTPGAANPYQR